MNYTKLLINLDPFEEYISDILSQFLADIGFETFESELNCLKAYIAEEKFNEQSLRKLIDNFPYSVDISYRVERIESRNWNQEWEKNFFQPIVVQNQCVIHSSFHKDVPSVKYDIVIDPKMSFGTGHHETTYLVMSFLLEMNLGGKRLLDMGCGTSILAILAAKKGASSILAVDVDSWCVDNSAENILLNNVKDQIEVKLGDANSIMGCKFEIILANINRNILLNDMGKYAQCLDCGGILIMSGFYLDDITVLEEEMTKNSLKIISKKHKNNWAAVEAIKIKSIPF